jgi:hypothetical protein
VKRVLTLENALENANVHICWDTMVLAHGSKGVEVEIEKMKNNLRTLVGSAQDHWLRVLSS